MRGLSFRAAGVVKGQRSSLKGGGSVLVVGNRRIPGAFIQQLKMAGGMSCSVWLGKPLPH
jgi:hypothetical protein